MKSIKMRGITAAVTGALLFGFGANAMADSTDDIINALIAKGVLTEEEGALLQKGREGEKFGAAKKPVNKEKDNMFSVESGDGNNSVALTGRMHFDVRGVDADKDQSGVSEMDRDSRTLADNFEIRRARIGVKGKFLKDFSYEVVGNLVGSNTNTLDVAFLNWAKYEPFQIRVGQFKQPFTLEELTSSNNIDFMERSYVNQITPGKKPGVMFHGVPKQGLTYALSAYQQNNWGEESAKEDGKSFGGRGTMNFAELAGWNTKETVLHIGAAGFSSDYSILPATSSQTSSAPSVDTRATVFSFRSGGRGLANAYRAQIGGESLTGTTVATGAGCTTNLNTGAVTGCTTTTLGSYNSPADKTAQVENKAYGLEFSAAQGPFKLQGEYTAQTFDASHPYGGKLSADVKAYYAEALWMLTGESYATWYKNGVWGAVKPKSNYDFETGKGNGAWELGLRFDAFDVDDTKITAGTTNKSRFQGSTNGSGTGSDGGAKTYTAGLKWVLNPNMRMMLNYSHTKYDTAFAPIDVSSGKVNDKEDLLMLRTQVAF